WRGPAFGGGIVGLLRLDPALAAGAFHLLPERRAGLEIVHQKLGSREGVAAMRRRRDDEHDVLARRDPSIAVDHRDAEQRPAPFGFFHVPCDLGFRHARIVFENQRRDGIAGLRSPAQAGERDHRADVAAPASERRGLGGDVEILALQPHRHDVVDHPPVIGGKKAISRAPAMVVSARTWLRSIAARITCGFSNAWAYSSPRCASQAMSSPTVAMPAGGSMSSSGLPMRSRPHAKYKSFTVIPPS